MRLYVVFNTIPTTNIASSEFYEWITHHVPGRIRYYNHKSSLVQGVILRLDGLLYVGICRTASRDTDIDWYPYESYESYNVEEKIGCLHLGRAVTDPHLVSQLTVLRELEIHRSPRL